MSPAAVETLVASHRKFLAFLERRVENRATAEDILQAAFARGLASGTEVDEENAVTWFYRVLRNALADHYRHRAAAARAMETFQPDLLVYQDPPPELREEICSCLNGVLDALKPEYKDALRVVDMEDGSLADLGRHAGISADNAAVRVHRARKALRTKMEQMCGTCAEHGCLDCRCNPASAGCGSA